MTTGWSKGIILVPNKTAGSVPHPRMPNLRLKRERKLRGWSQQYVAMQIDAARYYVSRWEIGIVSPSPDYRRKLCELFGMNAKELGLLSEDDDAGNNNFPDQPLWQAAAPTVPSSPSFLYDPAIPSQIHGLVGRDELLQLIKQRLFAGESLALSALNGLPGVGKTALAITIVNDDEVREVFRDGILWAGLGYQPDVVSLLSRWGALLGIDSREMAELNSVENWAKAIRARIGLCRMLLVIDDAWKLEEALAFKVGGPNCAHLVTTRVPKIASQFAQDGATVVRELSEDDSVTLMARLAPEVFAYKPDQIRSLTRSVGGLPLALTLMGNHLRTQTYPGSGPSRLLQAAFDRLQHAEQRLWLAQPQIPAECSPNLRSDMPLSLHIIIGISYQHLDDQAQYALRALSVFPAKPNTFSEEAALAICDVPVGTFDTLLSAGLLESSGSDRYTLHQVIADYAQLRFADTAVEERMARFFVSYVEAHKTDYEVLEVESNNVLAALQLAHEGNMSALLVQGALGFVPFLEARGQYAVAELHLKRAQQAAHALSDDVSVAATWLHLGQLAERRGDLARAEQAFQEGLAVARKIEHSEMMCALLAAWGEVAYHLGTYARAESYMQEGLILARRLNDRRRTSILLRSLGEIADVQGLLAHGNSLHQQALALAREIEDEEIMGAILCNLGVEALWRGEYDLAESYLCEGLEKACKVGHRQTMSVLLMHMGELEFKRERYTKAEGLYQESLNLARMIGRHRKISGVLRRLGELEAARENYVQAEAYLQESLQVAHQIGQPWMTSKTLSILGECYLDQQKLGAASVSFNQALATAQAIGAPSLIALARYGLARIAAAQANYVEARCQGEESLTLFRSLGSRERNLVEHWMAEMPQ
jgi:tetratricopeptide (TPR) repeat protein/transcriptional regulator with XRE-family HTH domain